MKTREQIQNQTHEEWWADYDKATAIRLGLLNEKVQKDFDATVINKRGEIL